jgi:hypothetical protein
MEEGEKLGVDLDCPDHDDEMGLEQVAGEYPVP